MESIQLDDLDKNWLQLVEELMESNLSKNEFRAFLEYKKAEKKNEIKQKRDSDAFPPFPHKKCPFK